MKTLGQIAYEVWRDTDSNGSNRWEAAAQAVRAAVIEELALLAESSEDNAGYHTLSAQEMRALKDKHG
jgi:hypothetical protein